MRRPADPKRFNGTVLVEWDNVTNQFDAENVWFFDWEHMMRAGYVWVGVSAQTVGVAALNKWSPDRYGTLDVGEIVASTGPNRGPDLMRCPTTSSPRWARRYAIRATWICCTV